MMSGERPGFDPTEAPHEHKTRVFDRIMHPGQWFKKGDETVVMPPDEARTEWDIPTEPTDVVEPKDLEASETSEPEEEVRQDMAA